jgi:hypothetical protein
MLLDDGDVSTIFDIIEVWRSFLWRRLECDNERRIIIKHIVDAAKIIMSGKTKRKIRIALELSRLKSKQKKRNINLDLTSYYWTYRSRPQ